MAATNEGSPMVTFGGQYPIRVIEFNLAAAGSAGSATDSETTRAVIKGTVEKVEIKSTTCRNGATITVYEENSPLSTKDACVSYTTGGTSVDAVFYPRKPCTNASGNNTTVVVSYANGYPVVDKFVVSDRLTCAVASANANDDFKVRIYVRG